ncbi:MAG: glycoside hydrolase family 97 protein [Bacteroidaceae bacterium]|nr:glycoside hydrolase family 97 protein [Bacteroidaceae bacterium]
MKKYTLLLLTWLLGIGTSIAQKPQTLISPNGTLKVEVLLGERLTYSISSDNDVVLKDATLSLQLTNETLGVNPKLRSAKRGSLNENIQREIPLKNALVSNHCNTLTLNMVGGYSVEFRAYDDGVAYRFVLSKKGSVDVINEDFTIGFPSAYQAHISKVRGFKTSYEQPYTHLSTAEYTAEDEMTYLPVLLESPAGYKVLISEANLCDYPAMFLKSTGSNGLTSTFPKSPLEFGDDGDRSVKITKEADYIARTEGTRTLPWRFFVISKDDKALVENEMVFKLSDACELTDFSWVKPGQVSWDWWNHWNVIGVDFKAGINTPTYKYYIDFASKYGIPYVLMDEGWSKSTREPFEANPDLNLPELIRYAKDKNVQIVLWLTWLTVENNFSLFEEYEKWGIAGVKIDFMDRSDQWMVNFYERVVKEAAKHHLFVDFHGAFKPAGLERRYPNLLSYEGVRGLEQGGGCVPSNSIYLPFMRGAVGPMDFTPGSMFSAQPEDNRSSGSNAMGSGTRAYQMALYVVFESGVQMLADTPMLYLQEDECTRFITSVPTTWDELKVLDAKVGEYVVVARRKGTKWFVGAITTDKAQQLTLNLDFLVDNAQHTLTSFEDGINAAKFARDYKKHTTTVSKGTQLTLNLVRNGGWCGIIE